MNTTKTLELAGETLTFVPMLLYKHIREAEAEYLKAKRQATMRAVIDSKPMLPEAEWRSLYRETVDSCLHLTVDRDGFKAWLDTHDGITFSTWLMLDGTTKERLPLERFRDAMLASAETNFQKAQAVREGMVAVGTVADAAHPEDDDF